MNFDFSEDVTAMRDEVRRVLGDRFPRGAVRQVVDTGARFDREFWSLLAAMGWLGIAIPERFGGAELGHDALCMIAEEVGAALPPVPILSTIAASEAILLFGDDDQRERWLPRLASGEIIGCLALDGGNPPVVDGDIADIAVIATPGSLDIVALDQPGVTRETVDTLDIVHGAARIMLQDVIVEELSGADVPQLLDRVGILVAFEQVGGAQAALDMAVDYARERYAFGRPIASFQAIKHKLADIYVALELARSNAYFGAWALESGENLPVAAAAARLAATEAFSLAARENIQTHGGMGFTWESDCHLYYRRARMLATQPGTTRYWRDRLIDHLDSAEAA
jgi:acyl-CoA dehydrogenase